MGAASDVGVSDSRLFRPETKQPWRRHFAIPGASTLEQNGSQDGFKSRSRHRVRCHQHGPAPDTGPGGRPCSWRRPAPV